VTEGGSLPRRQRPPRFADTKFLVPPPVAGVGRRPALHDRLSGSDSFPITVVVGAAGSGKTALLAEWFREQPDGSAVWLSADRGDADPVRFWRSFIAAVQRHDPTFGVEAGDILTLDGEVSADVLESLLVDESVLERRLTIVIDDGHLVSTDALGQLGRFVDRRPVNLRVVLGSRTDPSIGLARLRLKGAIAEIRDGDLRLDLDEVRSLLQRVGLAIDDIDIATLHRRTEGWAAAVQLAALSVIGAPDAGRRLETITGADSLISEYLLDEVLTNQPPHIHAFLESTCILDELDADICTALLAADEGDGHLDGRSEENGVNAAALLRDVEAANLFLTRVDPAGTVFRYHQLFADLLRDQLRTRDPERFRRQHRRAAEAYRVAGDTIRAVSHMWKAGDRDEAAEAVARNPLSVYMSPTTPPPIDLLDHVTDEELLGDSLLVGGYALALLVNSRAREASDLISRVDDVVGLDNFAVSERINLLSLQAGAKVLLGDTAAATANIRIVHDILDRGETTSDRLIQAAIPVGMRAAAWEGDLDLAGRFLAHFQSADPHLRRVDLVAATAMMEYFRGDLGAAVESSMSSVEAAAELGISGSGSEISAHAIAGASLVERCEFDSAEPHLAAVLDSPRLERAPSIVLAALARSRSLRARGDYAGALRAIAVARPLFGDVSCTLSNYLDLGEFMVMGVLRERQRCEELASRVLDPLLAGRMNTWCHLMHGRVAAAQATAAPLSTLAHTPRERFELGVLHARIAFDGESADLDARANELVDLAEQTGLLLHLGEGGTGVLEAVRRQARLRPRSDVTERLALQQPLPRPAHRLQPHHPHDELSAREQIVLRYMATSMSNQEIAAALFLSVNTVKTHVKNVLRKTHAESRQQAVERARALNYL
jgi:LuxR family transcriptional regulator, maltose regulon positive regulatory protein